MSTAYDKFIKESFGTVQGGERPLFRLVRGEDMYEQRIGTFQEFHGSIFLRETTGEQTRKKYPFLPPCWVIERWYPFEHPSLPETINRGTYEMIYAFLDKDQNPLPLKQVIISMVCKASLQASGGPMLDGKREVQNIQFTEEDKKAFEKETSYFEDVLHDNGPSPLLGYGEGIVVPHSYSKD